LLLENKNEGYIKKEEPVKIANALSNDQFKAMLFNKIKK
jgi:hypothetical protein